MKTKQEITELLEAAVQARELANLQMDSANLQMDDVLAETFSYIKSSRDERAEMEAQLDNPEEIKKHGKGQEIDKEKENEHN